MQRGRRCEVYLNRSTAVGSRERLPGCRKPFSRLAWPEAFLTAFSQSFSAIIILCFFDSYHNSFSLEQLKFSRIPCHMTDQLSNNKEMCEGNECTWEGWGCILIRSHHERIYDVVHLSSLVRIQPDLHHNGCPTYTTAPCQALAWVHRPRFLAFSPANCRLTFVLERQYGSFD